MVYKDLTFLLFAKDMGTGAAFDKVAVGADKMQAGVSGSLGMIGLAVAGAAIAVGAQTVRMAADFQTAVTRIRTDGGGAGESMGKLGDVIKGIGADTGTSMDVAAAAMYKVSSAGYTLANGGASVLKAALQGAAIGGADATTVADALTTVMTDFNIPASKAADTMSKLTETVATGKTNLNDLAGSLHSVLPGASAAGLGLAEVLSAVGTMTAEGISADQATQNLNHSILSLQAPSQVATSAMGSIGVSSLDVAKNLGKRGLAGTYEFLLSAMAKHSHAGLIAVKTFAQTAQATASMDVEVKKLPASLKPAALAFEHGHLTAKQWSSTLKKYPATVANLGKQFATTVKHTTGFTDALKNGSGPQRTAAAQLEKMLGGTTGLQVALHLTGDHMGVFIDNTKKIGKASTEAGGNVKGWGETQNTFNQQMKNWNAWLGDVGVTIGTVLLPAIGNFTANLIDGAKQWGQIFGAIGKWFGDTVKAFGDGFKQIEGFFSGMIHNFQDGGAQLAQIGKNIVDGLANGISGAWSGLTGTIHDLAMQLPKPIRDALGIFSPSKVFHEIGTWIGKGLENGILGTTSQVATASAGLANAVKSAFRAGAIGSGREGSLLHMIGGDARALESISGQRAGLTTKLGNLKTSRSGVYDNTKSSTVGAGDIMGFAATGDAVGGLRALVGKTKHFTADLKALQRKGVSGAMFTQLVDGWNSNPDNALAAANGLLANPGDLRQILALERSLNSAAGGLGSAAAHGEYDSRINATQGRIRVDTWRMQQLARSEAGRVAGGINVTVNLSGTYAGTKESLGKSIVQLLRDEVKKGTIPKNWATG